MSRVLWSVQEVSRAKALQAFATLQRPLIVEDSGFVIDALKGFPGPFSKYVLETIGIQGILKLMEGEKNRKCGWVGTATYVDSAGSLHPFNRLGGGYRLAHHASGISSPFAWSPYWQICEVIRLGKTLSALSAEELAVLRSDPAEKGSLALFAEWVKEQERPASLQSG